MKLRRIRFKDAGMVSLTPDDVFVLETIYGVRLRIFIAVFGCVALFAGVMAWPMLRSLFYNRDMESAVTIGVLFAFFILPFVVLFWRRIWTLKRDIRSGLKYEIWLRVIGKKHFPLTGQYFLSLDDVDYMHHEVEPQAYASVEVGNYYPVYFARHSRYAFNLRARFTGM
jgi:hypothetical protein